MSNFVWSIARRVRLATKYSLRGLGCAIESEQALRLEIFGLSLLAPLGLYFAQSGLERAVLMASLLLVLVVELLNSALETVVDRVSLEQHPLSARAKDIASAAVFLSIIQALVVWGLILL